MNPRLALVFAGAVAVFAWTPFAHATKSAEFYTTTSYPFGRFEASIRFPAGSGVVGSFFLWKDQSEVAGTFWNELDLEKIGADCSLDTNAFYGDPERVHTMAIPLTADLCGEFHTYAYEWTPEYIAWLVDGTEVRREVGETAAAYAENAAEGMQVRFNIWPGDASFGGVFDPSILPVYEYVDWVQYSAYTNGSFELSWREDFTSTTPPAGWTWGNWDSPKNLSTHSPNNVTFVDGFAVLALTDDLGSGTGGASPGVGGAAPGAGGAAPGAGGTGAPPTGGDTGVPFGQVDDDSGCSCRTGPARPQNTAGLGLLLSAIAVGWARRRRAVTPQRRQP
jgi:endo-1,3-1,4-beta-glycanase ExoK